MKGLVEHKGIPLRDDHPNAAVSRKLVDFESEVSTIEQWPDEQDRRQGFIVEVAGGRVSYSQTGVVCCRR